MNGRLTVTLKAMRFHARVGLFPHERELTQPLEIDITVTCAQPGGDTGSADSPGVDYRDLYSIARDVVTSGHTPLIEQIAGRIGDRVHQIAGVLTSRVAVRKPHVPLPGPLQYAEVVLERGDDA